MGFVNIAVQGGSALIGAGASIYGNSLMAGAAGEAAGVQTDALGRSSTELRTAGRDALAYLDPYRQYGLNAGSSLQDALYSPEQKMQQLDTQKASLEGEVARLQSQIPKWESYKILTGKNASERRAAEFTAESSAIQQKVAEAQAKLDTFNKTYDSQKASAGKPAQIQESPWYQFQADLLNRSMDRSMSAQGLTGSGAALEERRRGLIELGAGETERQFGRLKGMYDVGANAANVGAGVITGTAQGIANNTTAAGQANAQGIMGVAGANRDMVNGISNAVTGAVGAGLNYSQFSKLIAANAGRTAGTTNNNTMQIQGDKPEYGPITYP